MWCYTIYKGVPLGKSYTSRCKYYHWFRDGKVEEPWHPLACQRSLAPDQASPTWNTGLWTPYSELFLPAEFHTFCCDIQHGAYAHVGGISKAGVLHILEKYLERGIFFKSFEFYILLNFPYLFYSFICFHFDWYVCRWHCKKFQP